MSVSVVCSEEQQGEGEGEWNTQQEEGEGEWNTHILIHKDTLSQTETDRQTQLIQTDTHSPRQADTITQTGRHNSPRQHNRRRGRESGIHNRRRGRESGIHNRRRGRESGIRQNHTQLQGQCRRRRKQCKTKTREKICNLSIPHSC
jgi:hypothetical protein